MQQNRNENIMSRQEMSKASKISSTKEQSPNKDSSMKNATQPLKSFNDIKDDQTYTKGAQDPVGQDMRHSRQIASEFQKFAPEKKHRS